MAAKREALNRKMMLSGYFRELQEILDQNIPQEIIQIIISFQAMSLILAVGDNNRGTICHT